MDDIISELIWELFEQTGKIDYYLMYRDLGKKEEK